MFILFLLLEHAYSSKMTERITKEEKDHDSEQQHH